jgi:SAM-dependent methyltransferase
LTQLTTYLEHLRELRATTASALRELAGVPGQIASHRPSPPAEGFVLDVGGGQSPHPRADVVVDMYVVDDFERSGALNLSKPLIVADGQRLPFVDDTFAYVIAMHVLEHATDPVRFAAELSRVAAAGFVQVPSTEAELTFGWPFHPWTVDRDGDALVFSPKGDRRAPVGAFFHESYAQSPLLRLWWAAHRSRWHHSLEWRGALVARVEGDSTAEESASLDVERTIATLKRLRERDELQPLPRSLASRLSCPRCGGPLALEGDRASCSECEGSYPVVGPVPILLVEALDVKVAGAGRNR